jgi:molybdopterin-binding protein
MQLSARNQLRGRVAALRTEGLMAEVTIELDGGQQVVSIITRASAEALGLSEGDRVTAVIKSTDVIVAR